MPIGRPIPGTTVRVVDGVPHVAGPGLAELDPIAPARLVTVDDLPTRPNGKVDHAALDRRAADQLAGAASPSPASSRVRADW